MPAANVKGFYV